MPQNKNNQKTHTITIRVDKNQYHSLKQKANMNDQSISNYAREQLSLSRKSSIDIIALQDLTECMNSLLTSNKLNEQEATNIEERIQKLWESLN